MEKTVANISILDRNYLVLWNKENTKLQAFAVQAKGKSYFVDNPREVLFINKIIEQLNRKYVKREDVSYNGAEFKRFVNMYTRKKLFCYAR